MQAFTDTIMSWVKFTCQLVPELHFAELYCWRSPVTYALGKIVLVLLSKIMFVKIFHMTLGNSSFELEYGHA